MANGNGKRMLPKKKRNGGKKKAMGAKKKSPPLVGIKQAVASAVGRAMGATKNSHGDPRVFNAFAAPHLPLPRAVGGYTVVRTTQILTTNRSCHLFGPCLTIDQGTNEFRWSPVCHVSEGPVGAGQPINGTGNVVYTSFSALSSDGFNSATVCPASFSVQLMNPEALQTTKGVVYGSRAKQVLDFRGTTETWLTKFNELVSYTEPRLMSAAKLAMLGVTTDGVPLNMSELSNFREIGSVPTSPGDYDEAAPAFTGFGTIFFFSPSTPALELQFLICCEWRVRFDPLNPAHSSHVQHPVASDAQWQSHIHRMTNQGHGIRDMALSRSVTGNPQ